jgi:hypothetical protein
VASPIALYGQVEALVDPLPAADAAAIEACLRFAREALPEGRMAKLEAAGEFPAGELAAFARHGLARQLRPTSAGPSSGRA